MYTMMQVCREVGMTYQTLKFYCNEGLVQAALAREETRICCVMSL